jgi:hypothetical protein
VKAKWRLFRLCSALSEASEIVYCLFVPRSEGGEKEIEGMLVIDAAAVMAAGT